MKMQTGAAEKQNIRKTVLQLLKYMMEHRGMLAAACLCAVLTPVFSVRASYLLKPAINDYLVPMISQGSADLSGFIAMLAKMGLFYLISVSALYLQSRIMTRVCHETTCSLRCKMFDHMQRLPMQYFDTHASGKIVSAFSSDINTLNVMLKQSIPKLIDSIVSIVSIFVCMMLLSARLTLVVVIYLCAVTAVNKYLISNAARSSHETQESIREMNGFIAEVTEGQNVIKLNMKEDDMRQRFAGCSRKLFDASAKNQTYMNIIYPIGNGLSNAGFVLTAVFGALMVINGKSDVGIVCTFLHFYKQFYVPVSQISMQMGNVFSALAGAERIFILLNEKTEEDETVPGQEANETARDYRLQEGIQIRDMSFGYEPGKTVLKNISLNVLPGQTVAFVGPSGAGKTTVVNLINRFYDIGEGAILIDGVDIRQMNKRDLRSLTSIVLQETHLFTGTIRENIRFGRLDATDREVEEAAEMVNADFFIRHLPDQYETHLKSDGDILSDGQRQLIAIARAAISKAPILIMDEATSSVDTRTEHLIERGLKKLMKGRTVVMIAHRLSTVRNADIIVVLKDGKIVECGSHAELMEQKGMYYDLNTGSKELL